MSPETQTAVERLAKEMDDIWWPLDAEKMPHEEIWKVVAQYVIQRENTALEAAQQGIQEAGALITDLTAQMNRDERVILELQKKLDEMTAKWKRLSSAMDKAMDLGIYPKSTVTADGKETFRTEFQDGWNAYSIASCEELTKHLQLGDWREEDEVKNES